MPQDVPTTEMENVKSWETEDYIYARSPDFINLYANNARFGFTNWDMWMAFGEIAGEKEGKLVVAQRARVTMSLQHFKVFTLLLLKNLQGYEKDFGTIDLLGVEAPTQDATPKEGEAADKPTTE